METTFKLQEHDRDLIVVGIHMDAERYQDILAELPADIRERVVGWKRIGR